MVTRIVIYIEPIFDFQICQICQSKKKTKKIYLFFYVKIFILAKYLFSINFFNIYFYSKICKYLFFSEHLTKSNFKNISFVISRKIIFHRNKNLCIASIPKSRFLLCLRILLLDLCLSKQQTFILIYILSNFSIIY